MNILLIHHADMKGGAEKSLLDYLYGAKKNSIYIRFFVICPKSVWIKNELDRLEIEMINLPLFRIYRHSVLAMIRKVPDFLYSSVSIYRIILKKNIYLVHANSTSAYIQSIIPAKLAKRPIFWHIRDNLKKSFIEIILEKTADLIIPISRSVGNSLSKPNLQKVKIVYNGILKPRHIKNNSEIDQMRYTNYLLMISQFAIWKRHDVAIEAMVFIKRKYPNMKLVFAGEDLFNDNSDLIRQIKEKIRQKKLAQDICIVGYKENIREWIKRSVMVVHPALDEPLGRAVIEAMYLGKPVVTSRSGAFVEYLKDNVNGFLFDPGNPADMAKKIIQVIEHRNIELIRLNAKKTAHQLFDVNMRSREILNFYEQQMIKKH